MVNEEAILKGVDFPTLGFFILVVVSNSMFSAFPDDIQFDFYVGVQGAGKMICFDSVLEDGYSLLDEDGIEDYFNAYLENKTNLDKAQAALKEKY